MSLSVLVGAESGCSRNENPTSQNNNQVNDDVEVAHPVVAVVEDTVGVLDGVSDGAAKSAIEQKPKVDVNEKSLGDAARSNDLGNSRGLIGAGTYAFAASTGATLEDMSSGTTLLLAADLDDTASTIAPIGFDFWYDGVRHTSFSINANGLLKLGVAAVSGLAFTNGIATATNTPQILPYWDDLWIGNNGKVHYKVVGTAPNRKLVVEWQNEQIPRVATATAGAGTFQAWLSETTGAIDFVYGTGIAANTTNGGYTIGISTSATSFAAVTTSTNTVSYTAANDTQTNAIPAGTRYTFTPNVPTTDPASLVFTAVGLNSMTLNWTDGSSNEVGYAIYRSVDGVNYEFVRLTAADVTSSVETGLASNTTWHWKVATVTEGGVSAMSSGNQTTTMGTVSGTVLVGPTMGAFPTLTAALANITTNGLAGSVTLELEPTYTSAAETFPLTIGTWASPSNTITVRPATGATGLSITSASTTATIDLNGATNVIIDGRAGGTGPSQLTIANTATAGSAVRFINGASRNMVEYSTISGVTTATTSGVVLFSTSSTGVTGNNNNTIDHCDVKDGATTPTNGIVSIGTGTTTQLNTGNVISNNNIYDFFNAGAATNGIVVTTNTNISNTNWTISNNRFFQTVPRTYTTGATHRAILVSGGNGHTISGNVVGFANAAGTGTYTMTSAVTTNLTGIQVQVGPQGNTIQGNTIAGISLGTNSTAALTGISVTSGGVGITGNTIGSGTGNGSVALSIAGTAGGSFLVGVNVSTTTTGDVLVSNNTIGSLSATGTAALNTNMNVLQFTAGAVTCTNNMIGSTSTPNSIQVTTTGASATAQQLIGGLFSSTAPMTIRGNTFANLTNAGTGTAHVIRGLQYQGTGTATIALNSVHDISGASANTTVAGAGTAVQGMVYTGASPYGGSVTQNSVYAISATNAGAVATSVCGIGFGNPTNGTVTRNRVYDLRNASTGVSPTTPPRGIGLLIRATAGLGMSASNNMISLGDTATNTNTEFVGIMHSFSTTGINLSYNSVHIGGTAAAGSLPSYGFLRGDDTATSAITTPVAIFNNVFDNVRTGGTGKHYAIGNVNTAPATGWDQGASNNNVLNSAAASTVGIWGLAADQTFTNWQMSSASDDLSFSGAAVAFTNAATADLHFVCGATGTVLESNGVAIPGLAIDYDDQTRPGPTGSMNGGGTDPDIGADEFDCVPGCLVDAHCDDGNACTTESCNLTTFTCVTTPVVCNDNNDCTDDSCDAGAGCQYVNNTAPCDDNNACTQTDTCQAGACAGANPVVCVASDQCHVVGVCDTATGMCSNPSAADGTACSDGNGCTQTDTCQMGTCTGANPVVCAALDQCHVVGVCDTATGMCSNPNATDGTTCSDGNSCTQTDSCQMGTCTGANPVVCTALDQCHDVGVCDTATGTCSNPISADGTTCSDGNGCTQTDTCQMGTCTGANPVVCAALDQCHEVGTCDTATGMCSNPPVTDGTNCDDNNACTQMDACQAGTCTGANPVVCTALDQCHDVGICDTTTGQCSNPTLADGSTCSDNDGCTQMDTCQAGACVSGTPLDCKAQDECHEDGTCIPTVGMCDNAPKPDGTPCSNGGTCQSGTCTTGTGGSGGTGGMAGAGGSAGAAGSGNAGGSGGAGGGAGGEGGAGEPPITTGGGCDCVVAANTNDRTNVGAVLGAFGLLALGLRRRRPSR